MFCAVCGNPLEPIHGTATRRCCDHLDYWGYWSQQAPVARDRFNQVQFMGYRLYLSAKWPGGLKAMKPLLDSKNQ